MTDSIRKNWENLFVPDLILQAIEKEGYLIPTDIQKLTLPYAIRDKLDILGAAATGTGKTLAFGIPMVTRILVDKQNEIDAFEEEKNKVSEKENDEADEDGESEEFDLEPSDSELEYTWNDSDIKPEIKMCVDVCGPKIDKAKSYQHIYGLVLTPTRELACQVADHLKKICQFTDLKVCAIFGGMSVEKQQRLLSYRPEIVVVTPGRFWSFIKDQDFHAMSATEMSVLVLDEADRLLEKGHFAEVEHFMEWLKDNKTSKQRQTFVFSATLTFVHSSIKNEQKKPESKNDKLKKIVEELGMAGTPKIIDMTLGVAQLKHWKILCPTQPDKDSRLFWFLRHHPGRTLVFVNSKNSVRRLSSVLQQLGLHPKPLFADMLEKQRLKNLETFSKSANSLMIASDVAARGLDIPRVDYVVHFDVAHTAETHLHRSGRTARAAHPGHSVILLNPKEVGQLRRLLFSLKRGSEVEEDVISQISVERIEFIEKIVALARRLDSESHVSSKINKDKEWFTKMAEEADVILDEESVPVINKSVKDQRSATKLKAELVSMLKELDGKKDSYVSPISIINKDIEMVVAAKTDPAVMAATGESNFCVSKRNRRKKNKIDTKSKSSPPTKKIKLNK